MIIENSNLSKSAQKVQNALSERGLAFEVKELSVSTRTVKEAANAIGCLEAQIVKSLLFKLEKNNQPLLILASGINRVDEKLIAEKIIKADADFARAVTGFVIGGIPPVGHKNVITNIFIDEDLLKYDKLWAAAGTPYAVFSFHSSDLLKLTSGKIVAIK